MSISLKRKFYYVVADVVVQHADDGGAFVIGNVVEYFIDFIRMTNRNFDRMRIFKTVEIQGRSRSVSHKLSPYFEFGKEMVDAK